MKCKYWDNIRSNSDVIFSCYLENIELDIFQIAKVHYQSKGFGNQIIDRKTTAHSNTLLILKRIFG